MDMNNLSISFSEEEILAKVQKRVSKVIDDRVKILVHRYKNYKFTVLDDMENFIESIVKEIFTEGAIDEFLLTKLDSETITNHIIDNIDITLKDQFQKLFHELRMEC